MGKRRQGQEDKTFARLKEPTSREVDESIDAIAKYASQQVQFDYKGKLTPVDLRLITTVYVRRLFDLLSDGSVAWEVVDDELRRKC